MFYEDGKCGSGVASRRCFGHPRGLADTGADTVGSELSGCQDWLGRGGEFDFLDTKCRQSLGRTRR